MPWKPEPLRKKIPGTTGKRVPGGAQLPRIVGFNYTNVPVQSTSSQFREFHRQQVRDRSGKFAGGWGFAWQGLSNISANIEANNDAYHKGLEAAMESLADRMVEWAQNNAPWIDYPGDPPRPERETEHARENIQAAVVKESDEQYSIYIGHGKNVYYGIWLEVRWNGKYAIVLPTVYQFAPQLGSEVQLQTR